MPVEGTQIGAYQIERQLGRGGFGVVYVGVDVRLGRRAAVKQLLPELSQRHEIVERFFNEARAAAAINHPGIVEIYEVGWHTDGSAYFAMKLLDGDSLAKRLRENGMLSVPVATTIARQVASALAAAHARGIVHRDLKPDNIVLVPDEEIAIGERATVLDFGIAKLFGDQPTSQRTATGMMMGTPAYMSPEQCRGAGEVDQRTDVYALACILYEMLAGRPPFVGEGAGEVLGMHQFVETPMLRGFRPDAPEELEAVVMRALAKKPEGRFQQMSEIVAALQPFTTGAASSVHRAAFAPRPQSIIDPRAATMPSVGLDVRSQTTQRSIPEAPADTISQAARAADKPPSTTMRSSSAELVKQPPEKRTRAIWFVAGGAALAIAAGATAFAVMREESTSTTATAPPPALDAATDAVTVVETTPDAEVVAETPPDAASTIASHQSLDPIPVPTGNAASAMIRGECQRHLSLKDYKALEACATKLAKYDRAAAEKYRAAARAGTSTSAEMQQLDEALAKNDFRLARALVEKLRNDATEMAEAKKRYNAAADRATIELEKELKLLADAQDCIAYNKVLRERIQTHGAEIVNTARKPVPCTPSGTANPPPPACNAAELVRAGDQLYNSGQFRPAYDNFVKAFGCSKEQTHAVKALMAACRTKNEAAARKLYGKLHASRQGAARGFCASNGVMLEDPGSGAAE